VFNSVFGTKLAFLPDRSYVSSWSLPYDLTEVKVATPAPVSLREQRIPPLSDSKDVHAERQRPASQPGELD
jgi:hypothetical protein